MLALAGSRRVVPQLSRLLLPEAELDYVEFDGGHAVASRVADEVGRCNNCCLITSFHEGPSQVLDIWARGDCHPGFVPASALPRRSLPI